MDTWITATIRGMDTTGRRRSVATERSTTSREMRLGMGKGISARPGIALPGNIALALSAGAVDMGVVAATS
jgi:hypothetical protein